jgi:hypothetical protein
MGHFGLGDQQRMDGQSVCSVACTCPFGNRQTSNRPANGKDGGLLLRRYQFAQLALCVVNSPTPSFPHVNLRPGCSLPAETEGAFDSEDVVASSVDTSLGSPGYHVIPAPTTCAAMP